MSVRNSIRLEVLLLTPVKNIKIIIGKIISLFASILRMLYFNWQELKFVVGLLLYKLKSQYCSVITRLPRCSHLDSLVATDKRFHLFI